MPSWLMRRLATAVATFVLLTFLLHAAVRWLPGEPITTDEPGTGGAQTLTLRPDASPVEESYLRWMGQLARLDLGVSIAVMPGRPVTSLLRDALPWSLWLGALAMIATFATAIPLAALSARRPLSAGSRAVSAALYLLQALPVFWVALVLQHLIAVRMAWLPLMGPGGSGPTHDGAWPGAPAHWVLPCAALALGSLALAIRLCRDALESVARAPLSRAARARGASLDRVMMTHGLSGAAVPMVSLAALMLPGLVSGSVLVESIFALPGAGRLLYVAASRRDAPVLLGVCLLAAAATLAASVLADAAYRLLDPRTRHDGSKAAA
ncbi:MAG: ABC transporter permease [Candidatus Polarisedimenticolia bacterium]